MHTYLIDIFNIVELDLVQTTCVLIDRFEELSISMIGSYNDDKRNVCLTFDVYDETDHERLISLIEQTYNQSINQMRLRIIRRA